MIFLRISDFERPESTKELKKTGLLFNNCMILYTYSEYSEFFSTSDFARTGITVFFDERTCFIHSRQALSSENVSGEKTHRRISEERIASCVFSIRCAPSSESSPKPAVSIKTTGPIPGSSAFFLTVSVVVPLRLLTIAACCPVSMLKREDFPELVFPIIPI